MNELQMGQKMRKDGGIASGGGCNDWNLRHQISQRGAGGPEINEMEKDSTKRKADGRPSHPFQARTDSF